MRLLLVLAHRIDALNDRFAVMAKWAIVASCAISAGNAFIRYLLSYSSNGWIEIQWYLFAACVMFGASQVLRVNEHVRVDVLYGSYPTRMKVIVDILGIAFFLIPLCAFIAYASWPVFHQMYVTQEMSSNAGGLIRWPAMLTIPVGMALVALQGVAELIKRVAWLMHRYEMDTHYERPLQ